MRRGSSKNVIAVVLFSNHKSQQAYILILLEYNHRSSRVSFCCVFPFLNLLKYSQFHVYSKFHPKTDPTQ